MLAVAAAYDRRSVAAVYDRRCDGSADFSHDALASDAHRAPLQGDALAGDAHRAPLQGDALAGDARVLSNIPLEAAAKRPLDSATLVAQLGRLGDTCYELASLDNRLAGDCHLPISVLNQVRRELVRKLERGRASQVPGRPAITTTYQDLLPSRSESDIGTPRLSVLCRDLGHLRAAMDCGVETVYCDFEDPRRYKEAVAFFRSKIQNQKSKIHLATPRILKPGETGYLKLIEHAGPDGLLLRNPGALHYYKNRSDLEKVGDFSLNVANPISARLLMENAGLDYLTISYDLNIGQVLELLGAAPPEWFELTLHQHMPMFHMEHCVFCVFLSQGTHALDCGRPCEHHVVHLRDRVGQLHRLQADVGCRNTLFNGKAQTGAGFFETLHTSGLRRFRVELLDEDQTGATAILRAYQDLLVGAVDPRKLLDKVQALEQLGVTEGTLANK
jgi:putative protease